MARPARQSWKHTGWSCLHAVHGFDVRSRLEWRRALNEGSSSTTWPCRSFRGSSTSSTPASTTLTQRSARILDPGNSRRESASFFSLDHEKWFSEVSISSRNMRVTKWNLVLVSKYENGHMIISISSRQARARKIILNLVSKNCTFSQEWDSKSNPKTGLHSRQS